MEPCVDCGKVKRTCERSLSANTLIFGPVRTALGYMPIHVTRCQACETKLTKRIVKMIDSIKTDDTL